MSTQTFYLKYRPQKVAELDINSVRDNLAAILKNPRLPHAFLFSGPRGSGKTSAARILAKAINCEKNDRSKSATGPKPSAISHFEPCNKCSSCISITRGSNLDTIEIDAASNRGVDDIRSLREGVKLAPSASRYKVYIIDEAHMLTIEASNALLKTLEEPPRHVVFILATTAPDKLTDTIRSRCHQIKFTKATPDEIKRALSRPVKGEHLKIAAEILDEIATKVDGSLRDAHKLLERLVLAGKTPTKGELQHILGEAETADPQKLIDLLLAKDTLPAIDELARLDKLGIDWVTYAKNLLDALRVKMLDSLKNSPAQSQSLRQLIKIIAKAALDIPRSTIPQLPLELAIVDWCQGSSPDTPPHPVPPTSSSSSKKSPSPNGARHSDPKKLTQIQSKWPEVLKTLRPYNHSIEALLRAAHPAQASNGQLILEVFYKFHKEQLEQEKCRRLIEKVVSDITGHPTKLFYRLGQKPPKIPAASPSLPSEPPLEEVASDAIFKLAQQVFTSN